MNMGLDSCDGYGLGDTGHAFDAGDDNESMGPGRMMPVNLCWR